MRRYYKLLPFSSPAVLFLIISKRYLIVLTEILNCIIIGKYVHYNIEYRYFNIADLIHLNTVITIYKLLQTPRLIYNLSKLLNKQQYIILVDDSKYIILYLEFHYETDHRKCDKNYIIILLSLPSP